MHSHDRTLLARLGFADPDKQNPTHDLICQYVGTDETVRKIINVVHGERLAPRDFITMVPFADCSKFDRRFAEIEFRGQRTAVVSDLKWHFESALTKGDGQYKQLIGFLDVLITGVITTRHSGEVNTPAWEDYFVDGDGNEIGTVIARSMMDARLKAAAEEWRGENAVAIKDVANFNLEKSYSRRIEMKFRGNNEICYVYQTDSIKERSEMIEKTMMKQINDAVASMPDTPKEKRRIRQDWVSREESKVEKFAIAVEVKVAPVGSGDILRQVNLYREHFDIPIRDRYTFSSKKYDHAHWIVITDFAQSPIDQDMLRQSKITPIRLSTNFDEWVAKQNELCAGSAESAALMVI